jgi:cysteine-rich repeat protein
MPVEHIKMVFSLLLPLAAVASSCHATGQAPGASAFTCPPGMALAARQPICIHGHCANGTLDEDEACDDGNLIAGDGCSPDCHSIETCGNRVVDHVVGEVCDDGNTESGDECCGDCRSCPERMTMVPAVAPGQALAPPSAASSETFSPLLFTAPPMPISSVSAESVPRDDAESTRMEMLLTSARNAMHRAQQLAKLEARERSQLAARQVELIEQTQRDQEAIVLLEQANAELQEYIAAECQRFPSDRSNSLP